MVDYQKKGSPFTIHTTNIWVYIWLQHTYLYELYKAPRYQSTFTHWSSPGSAVRTKDQLNWFHASVTLIDLILLPRYSKVVIAGYFPDPSRVSSTASLLGTQKKETDIRPWCNNFSSVGIGTRCFCKRVEKNFISGGLGLAVMMSENTELLPPWIPSLRQGFAKSKVCQLNGQGKYGTSGS